MGVLASPSSTIRARYRHIEDGFPRSISSSRPVDISTSINPYRARFPELDLFIEAGWHIELDKVVSSSVAQKTKLIPNIYLIFLPKFSQLALSNSLFTVLFAYVNFFASFVVRDLCRSGWRQNYYLTLPLPPYFFPWHKSFFNTSDSYLKSVRA